MRHTRQAIRNGAALSAAAGRMSEATPAQQVEMVPVADVVVINPRARNRRVFNDIVESIALVGLKRPITVTRHYAGKFHALSPGCGQGRLEAMQAARIRGSARTRRHGRRGRLPCLEFGGKLRSPAASCRSIFCEKSASCANAVSPSPKSLENRPLYEYVNGVTRLLARVRSDCSALSRTAPFRFPLL